MMPRRARGFYLDGRLWVEVLCLLVPFGTYRWEDCEWQWAGGPR